MDENQNNEIDFSSQPLGLMAQEGAQIEQHMENEMRLNEANRNKPQEGENPFEGIDFRAAKKEQAPDMMVAPSQATPVEEPKKEEPQIELKPEPQPQEIISLNSTAEPNVEVTQFEKSEMQNGFGEDLKPQDQMNEEDRRKQSIMDELNRERSEIPKEEYKGEQPSTLGVLGAIVLFAVFGFAIFLFTSGKLDSFLDKHKKDDTVEIEAAGDEEETEEETKNPETPTLGTLKNYKANESVFMIVDGVSMSVKYEGIFDLEHEVYIGRQITSTGGRTANLKVNIDIGKKIYYFEDTSVTPPVWRKTSTTVTDNVDIDKRLKVLQENGTFEEKETNHFVGKINSTLLADAVGARIDQSLLKSGDIEVDFNLENGRIRKIKYNFTSIADESVDTLIYSAEFYDVNANGPQSIPQEIVEKAKSL